MSKEALNSFCVNYAKLVELCAHGKKETEEAYKVIADMRVKWELLNGEEAHYLERFTVKLADMGYYKAPAPKVEKVDISDLEFDDNSDVKGDFKHARKMVKNNGQIVYAAYNYNEHSKSIHELPESLKREILAKFAANMKSTEECMSNPTKAVHNTKRRHIAPKLQDSERDW